MLCHGPVMLTHAQICEALQGSHLGWERWWLCSGGLGREGSYIHDVVTHLVAVAHAASSTDNA